jgi:hypothetical protein
MINTRGAFKSVLIHFVPKLVIQALRGSRYGGICDDTPDAARNPINQGESWEWAPRPLPADCMSGGASEGVFEVDFPVVVDHVDGRKEIYRQKFTTSGEESAVCVC